MGMEDSVYLDILEVAGRPTSIKIQNIGEVSPLGIYYNPQTEYGETDLSKARKVDKKEFKKLAKDLKYNRKIRKRRYSYIELINFLDERGAKPVRRNMTTIVNEVIRYTDANILEVENNVMADYAAERLTKLRILDEK